MKTAEETPIVMTIGHSTRTIDEFIHLLKLHEVTLVVDVRTIPRSRHNPQFNKETLPASLKAVDIGYIHMMELGGLRHTLPDSLNIAWRNLSFRGYADYMQTEQFQEAIEKLIELTCKNRVALMCAETIPWRCHRSLIEDALVVRGIPCEDIISSTSHHSHTLTSFAEANGTRIVYPGKKLIFPKKKSR